MSAPAREAASRPRRRIAAAGVAVAAVVGVGLLPWPFSGRADTSLATAEEMQVAAGDAMAATVLPGSPGAGPWGVGVAVGVTFDEDRVLTRGRILVAPGTPAERADFTPRDGTDEDSGYPTPLQVDRGVKVAVEATVLPACGVEVTAAPVFEIQSRPASGVLARSAVRVLLSDPRTDTAAVTDLASWRSAVREWCASGVQAHLSPVSTTPEGEVSETVTLYNPGPGPAAVISAAQRDGDGEWEHAAVTVAGGSVAQLTIHGTHVDWRRPPLTADGEPLALDTGY